MNLNLITIANTTLGKEYEWDTDIESAGEIEDQLQGNGWLSNDLEFYATFGICQTQSLENMESLSQWAVEHADIAVEFIDDHLGDWAEVESAYDDLLGIYASFKDYAYEMVDNGSMGEIEGPLSGYIDYDMLARDLEIEYSWYEGVSGDIYIFCH